MNTLEPSFLIRSSSFFAGSEAMHESLNEFKFRPDTTTDSKVICPCASEKLTYNVVNSLAPLF